MLLPPGCRNCTTPDILTIAYPMCRMPKLWGSALSMQRGRDCESHRTWNQSFARTPRSPMYLRRLSIVPFWASVRVGVRMITHSIGEEIPATMLGLPGSRHLGESWWHYDCMLSGMEEGRTDLTSPLCMHG